MFEKYLSGDIIRASLKDAAHYHPFPKASEREAWSGINFRAAVLAAGEGAKEGYPMLKATDFMEYKRSGNRKVYEKPYFERRMKLMHAVTAECAAGNGSFLNAVIDGVWCILEETSWIISAHNNAWLGREKMQALPDPEEPIICLFSAQTAQIMAYTLYLLENCLNAEAPIITQRIRTELDKRIFTPFLQKDDIGWMGANGQRLSNWTPWILSNVIETFLLVCEDRERRIRAVEKSMVILDRYLAGQPQDGGCDEGTGYWNAASGGVLDCLDELYRATGGRVNCYAQPKIAAIGTFPLNAHIDGKWYWNFADCDAQPIMDGERIACFGEATDNKELIRFGQEILEKEGSRGLESVGQMNRLLNRLFRKNVACGAAAVPDFVYLPDTQICAYRRDGLYGVIKGGHNAENHNHNDVGSFMIYLNGSPQVVDLGNIVYTAKTFSPERYTIVNTRSRNHNVPLIGGIEQSAGSRYRADMMDADENGVTVEFGKAYPEEAGVERILRSFSVKDGAVCVKDRIVLKEETVLSWVFMVMGKPEWNREASCVTFGGLRLVCPEGGSCDITPVPDVDGRMLKRFPEPVYRIEISYPAEKNADKAFLFEVI